MLCSLSVTAECRIALSGSRGYNVNGAAEQRNRRSYGSRASPRDIAAGLTFREKKWQTGYGLRCQLDGMQTPREQKQIGRSLRRL